MKRTKTSSLGKKNDKNNDSLRNFQYEVFFRPFEFLFTLALLLASTQKRRKTYSFLFQLRIMSAHYTAVEYKEPVVTGTPLEDAPEPNYVSRQLSSIFPVGGFLGTIFSISATVIGAGLLSFPSSFKDVGMFMAIFYLTLVAAASIYTMRLLAILAERTGIYSLEALSTLYLNTAASIVLGIIRIIFCFGACVAYVISVGDLLRTIIDNSSNAPEFLRTNWGEKMLQTLFWLLFMLSVVIPRQINTLRYISAAGVGFIVLFVVVIVIHACMNGLQEHPRPEVQIVGTGNNALNGVGVFIFSFVNQFNCLEMYQEMNPRTKSVRNYTICCVITGTFFFVTHAGLSVSKLDFFLFLIISILDNRLHCMRRMEERRDAKRTIANVSQPRVANRRTPLVVWVLEKTKISSHNEKINEKQNQKQTKKNDAPLTTAAQGMRVLLCLWKLRSLLFRMLVMHLLIGWASFRVSTNCCSSYVCRL
eukprot:gene3666-2596_t